MENIAHLIPHRPPMHWLDQAWLEPDGSIGARRTFRDDNAVINSLRQGAVIPPSVLVEMLAQTAACSAGLAARRGHSPMPSGRLVAIEKIALPRRIYNGDTVELRVRILRQWQTLRKCRLLATVNGQVAAEGVATFALVGAYADDGGGR